MPNKHQLILDRLQVWVDEQIMDSGKCVFWLGAPRQAAFEQMSAQIGLMRQPEKKADNIYYLKNKG